MKISELKKAIKGVDVVMTTPFNKDGSVDLGGMRANTQWLLERTKGKDFIITPMGSTGEFYAMSEEECKSVAKTVVDTVKGQNITFVGAGRAGTQETIKMAKYAESIGADGVQVVLPYYHVPEEDGMYAHYKAVAESVNIGIMIYNNPDVSGSWIKPPLMAKLSKIPNIIALKENNSSIQAFYNMARAIDPWLSSAVWMSSSMHMPLCSAAAASLAAWQTSAPKWSIHSMKQPPPAIMPKLKRLPITSLLSSSILVRFMKSTDPIPQPMVIHGLCSWAF
jgi:dihydrodipicolinate synthase/N-acetylneuraminate lyase